MAQRQRITAPLSLSDALARLVAPLAPLAAEVAAPALGRTLAGPLDAPARPPGARAARDGWAVRAEATAGAGPYNPLPLTPGVAAFAVSAGDPLPAGCDAVVADEGVEAVAGALLVVEAAAPGAGVEAAGADWPGGTLLSAGRTLDAAALAVLSVLGVRTLSLVRRPRVRIVLTGDAPADGAAMLSALVARDGGIADAVRAPDDPAALAAALASASAGDADLLLATGGTGTGAGDRTVDGLRAAGTVAVHGIGLRPGGTTAVGTVGGRPAVLLPGRPAAALAAYEMLAGSAVRRLAGRADGLPHPTVRAHLARKLVSSAGDVDVIWVRHEHGGAEPVAAGEGAGILAVARADGFVVVPAGSEGFPAGASVDLYLTGWR